MSNPEPPSRVGRTTSARWPTLSTRQRDLLRATCGRSARWRSLRQREIAS